MRSRHRGSRPWRHYVRRRLRRRLFAWFGVSIIVSVGLAGALVWALSPAANWSRHVEDLRTFVSGRFAQVWDDPTERDALAEAVSHDLNLGVTLQDARGQALGQFGPTCERGYPVPIQRDGQRVGEAVFCLPHDEHAPAPMWLALLAGIVVLWAASGIIAHRLTRPLWRLVQATRQIAEGNLDVDVRLGPREVDELHELAGAMRDMLARIRKQIDDQRELLAAVSHEIRTPLGHLRVLIDLARDSGTDQARLGEIELEVLAIDRIVEQLVANSRLEFGTLDRRTLDAVQLGLNALDRAGLDPTLLEATDETITVEADAALLGQALANLLRNAQEHGGGVAKLVVAHHEDVVHFEVADAGPGFESNDGDVFAAFARGHQPRGGSLGLGLALVRGIAEAHEGTAWAKSPPGGGARVGFSCVIAPTEVPSAAP